MTTDRAPEYIASLIQELRKLPAEIEWVEFKENNDDPEEIGEYLSALANSAALCGKAFAYLVWGVRDVSHELVGTTVSPTTARVTNTTLRERFGIEAKNSATASRLIKEALEGKAIRLHDESAPPKLRKYVPWWVGGGGNGT